MKKNVSVPYNSYLLSIDPNNYIKDISPRLISLFHSKTDSTIQISNAKATFDLANDPKKFFIVEYCAHGYCEAMYDNLMSILKDMLKP